VNANPLAPTWLVPPSDANALAPGVWPAHATRGSDGEVMFAGVASSTLIAEFGSPVYVLDEADARARAARIRELFTDAFGAIGAKVTVYYAGKAFLSAEVVRWMTEEGLSIDVASGGELALALAAGVDAELLGVHGNNKSAEEIDSAVTVGAGAIVLDSEIEIERVAETAKRHGVVQRVRLRTNTGVHAHTHEFLATAREDQKFGVPLSEVAGHVKRIRALPSLEFLGLHSHIGSQIFEVSGFVEAIARLIEVHAGLLEGGPVPQLNLGGGFGIAYTSVDDVVPIEEMAEKLAGAVAAEAERHGIAVPDIAIEPGRAIVGPAGATLYTVGTIKDVEVATDAGANGTQTAVRRYVSVDGGMSDNIRPALYEADYTVRMANRTSAAEPALVRIAGKHCESGDIVVHADYLPGDVTPGDTLAVAATGAYCWSLASNYNFLVRPAVVAVNDGTARAIVRRETIADLLGRDLALTTAHSNDTPGKGATR